MNHIYQDIPGWFTYKEFYDFVIKKLPNNSKVAEVGCYQGQGISYLTVESLNNDKNFEITAIDCWPGDLFQIFKNNISPIIEHVKTIHAGSLDAAKQIDNNSLDLVYIDAEHSYNAVIFDIRAWLPKIKIGGIISGHDYDLIEHPDVCRAVDESLTNVFFIKESWYHIVTGDELAKKPKTIQYNGEVEIVTIASRTDVNGYYKLEYS